MAAIAPTTGMEGHIAHLHQDLSMFDFPRVGASLDLYMHASKKLHKYGRIIAAHSVSGGHNVWSATPMAFINLVTAAPCVSSLPSQNTTIFDVYLQFQ